MIRTYTAAALVTLLVSPTYGFTVTNNHQSRNSFFPSLSTTAGRPITFQIASSADGQDIEPEPADVTPEPQSEVATPEVKAEESGEGAEGEAVAPEEEESEEDAKIKELKTDIADLELTLKNKNRELDNIEKFAEQYTKGGYARKVAEMESYRRSRTAASADSNLVAKASVLQNFLPIVDTLKSLSEQYDSDEFGKKYSALSWDFNNAMKDLGVSEYSLGEGQQVDPLRVAVVEEEYSDIIAKGNVIRAIENGFELEGNVMRMATAVVSLGVEEEEVAEAQVDTDSEADAPSEGETEEGPVDEAEA